MLRRLINCRFFIIIIITTVVGGTCDVTSGRRVTCRMTKAAPMTSCNNPRRDGPLIKTSLSSPFAPATRYEEEC